VEKLYRYIGGNEENLLRILRSVFEDSRLWFSDPFDFNDPMELNCRVDYDRNYEFLDGSLLFDRIRSSDNGQLSEEVWMSLDDEKRRLSYQADLREGLKDLFRIICFSKKCDNNLMWSHYAAKHSGVCLVVSSGFLECCNQETEAILAYGDVEYGEEPPLIRSFHDHTDNVVKAMVFNKSSDWSYEAEYRVLAHGIKLDSDCININKQHLIGVILGNSVCESVENYCVNQVKLKMRFSVKKARVSKFSYKMSFEDL
jgi:hypothetical protein